MNKYSNRGNRGAYFIASESLKLLHKQKQITRTDLKNILNLEDHTLGKIWKWLQDEGFAIKGVKVKSKAGFLIETLIVSDWVNR